MIDPPQPSEEIGENKDTNIFYLSKCAYTSAEWMHEKHTVKMITESAQMLSTAVQLLSLEADSTLYKPAYIFHPCTQWLIKSVWHYEWLMRHYEALSAKYTRLFNRNHLAYHKLVAQLREYYYLFPDNGWIDPPLCMPDKYKSPSLTTEESYRAYYLGEKIKGRCYYRVNPPFWIDRKTLLTCRKLAFVDESGPEESP